MIKSPNNARNHSKAVSSENSLCLYMPIPLAASLPDLGKKGGMDFFP
jgi:hypothetical protein